MQITLDCKRLDLIFVFCLSATLISPSLFPQLRLLFFAPFLVCAFYQKTLQTTLWLAFACGICLDLLSSHSRLGLYAMGFCLTTAILYPQKRNFFADSLSTLPIMTLLFGSLSTLILGVLLYSLEMRNVFSWHWVLTDLILMPSLDACYAFSCFIFPALFLGKPLRKGKDYFLIR
jgi:rod shape-determining protein MreD